MFPCYHAIGGTGDAAETNGQIQGFPRQGSNTLTLFHFLTTASADVVIMEIIWSLCSPKQQL